MKTISFTTYVETSQYGRSPEFLVDLDDCPPRMRLDYVKRNEIQIKYCPTEKMLADFFTKSLQGSLFRKFRAIIMGWEPLSALQDLGELKERVEK